MDVAEIVSRLWPGARAEWVVLGERGTRHNVRVDVDGGTFVLRSGGRDTELLGIDRRREYEACLAAAAVGVGPEVVEFLEADGVVVTQWIEGEVLTEDAMRAPAVLRRVAQALRAVHAAPPLPGRFDVFRIVEEYRSLVFSLDMPAPPEYAWARQIARRIEAARGPAPERPCHNDLNAPNVIDDGRRLRIVDWEYAGMGDLFFDLACVAETNDLDGDDRALLLEAYSGSLRAQDVRALELMRFMAGFREAMWAIAQGALGELDADFDGSAEAQWGRLARTVDEPAFVAALG